MHSHFRIVRILVFIGFGIVVFHPLVSCGEGKASIEAKGSESVVEGGQSEPVSGNDGGLTTDVVDTVPETREPDAGTGSFVVVTFNTGTTTGLKHDSPPDDGYTSKHAEMSDKYYGDGLAWVPVVEATKAFFAKVRPDVVVFQELFYSGNCPSVPKDKRKGFVCETWKPGDPTVVQVILGQDYQVMCHPGKPDKCAAVKKSFGTFRGCKKDFCLAGLEGFRVKDCGGGARVARGVIERSKSRGGGIFTLVSVHGSSGLKAKDSECRTKQVEQVFFDFGDGQPGVNGSRHLIMGDLNIDPVRASFDKSAKRWNDFVGPTKKFHFISEVGEKTPPTYLNLLNIDHVISDTATGNCWAAGLTAKRPPVTSIVYFDHKPIVCTIAFP